MHQNQMAAPFGIAQAGTGFICKEAGNGTTPVLSGARLEANFRESEKDDNPDISGYAGRADLAARWGPWINHRRWPMVLRNNLSGKQNRSVPSDRLGDTGKNSTVLRACMCRSLPVMASLID